METKWMLLFLCFLLGASTLAAEEEEGVEVEADPSTGFLSEWRESWVVRLILNVLSYSVVFIPGYLLIAYYRRIDYISQGGSGWWPNVVRMCVYGRETPIGGHAGDGSGSGEGRGKAPRSFSQKALVLSFCTVGLLVSYLCWGVLQERIMKHDYSHVAVAGSPALTDDPSHEPVKFTNSQFLVFINRVLALAVALGVVYWGQQPPHTAPLYKYSYCSFSNIMSSWFQYEALKFVSFPTQVLVKASKVIPVMLMGKVVSNKTYKLYEYVTAFMLSVGVFMFLMGRGERQGVVEKATTLSGAIIMIGYMMFDSFTSNWQNELFTQYKMSSMQMMAGVNLFSSLLTGLSLMEQGTLLECLRFMMDYPQFNVHAVMLSVCSAVGQLFIFYTISQFGPVTFTIIMTIRMGLSILLSCVVYGHSVAPIGFLGIMIVFASLFGKIYWKERTKGSDKPMMSHSGPKSSMEVVISGMPQKL